MKNNVHFLRVVRRGPLGDGARIFRNPLVMTTLLLTLLMIQACAPMSMAQSPFSSLVHERCKDLKGAIDYQACRGQANAQQKQYDREAADMQTRRQPFNFDSGRTKAE